MSGSEDGTVRQFDAREPPADVGHGEPTAAADCASIVGMLPAQFQQVPDQVELDPALPGALADEQA